ncbi:M13 family metallopeptidase [Ruminiclostridium sufflavum]|nr:M13 family metallopeptidase [Ruminiclostridium sufflavum]
MIKKKLLSTALVLLLLLTIIPTAALASEPVYVTRGTVCDMLLVAADDYTEDLTRGDIIKGYGDGELKEDQLVTRAEAFVMISHAFGELPAPVGNDLRLNPQSVSFTEVPVWAQADVNNLVSAGVVIGSIDSTLYEKDNVTAEQVQTVINRIWALKGSNLKDDFYNTVNKAWLDQSVIKPGETSAGGFVEIDNLNNERLTGIINEIISGTYSKGTKEQKISDFYHSVLDMDARNKQGIAPIKSYLDEIDAVDSMDKLYAVQKTLLDDLSLNGLFSFSVDVDMKDSNKYTIYFSGISPEIPKELYAAGDSPQTTAYKNHLKTLLDLSGDENAQEQANAFYEMEKVLSQSQLDTQDYGNVDKINNAYTVDQLQAIFPAMDVRQAITDSGYQLPDKVIILDVELTEAFAKYYTAENLSLLKTIVKLSLLFGYGDSLGQDFLDASDAFRAAFYGVEGTQSDAEIASLETQNIMSDYLGKAFIDKYFSARAKQDVENMVTDFISIYKSRVSKLDWMSAVTKQMAIKKLDTMTVKIGYPDSWESPMDKVEIKSGSYFSNMTAIAKQSRLENIALQGRPVDNTKWMMSAYEVNAYYNPTANEIVFPAGILQAPFYDINASKEANLGGIGTVIAHEITHAFDNNGAKFDENGNAVNWWTASDYQKFEALCAEVTQHYNGYESAPGIYLNGALTLSENIADLGGMACALESMKKLSDPDYDAFFKNNAKIWEMTCTRQYLELLSQMDVHSPNKARTNQVVQNFEEFYQTYGITEKDGMYTPVRVQIW